MFVDWRGPLSLTCEHSFDWVRTCINFSFGMICTYHRLFSLGRILSVDNYVWSFRHCYWWCCCHQPGNDVYFDTKPSHYISTSNHRLFRFLCPTLSPPPSLLMSIPSPQPPFLPSSIPPYASFSAPASAFYIYLCLKILLLIQFVSYMFYNRQGWSFCT